MKDLEAQANAAAALRATAVAADELISATVRLQLATQSLSAALAAAGVHIFDADAFGAQLDTLVAALASGAHDFRTMASAVDCKPSQAV
jgi:hypothetical protein